MRTHWSVLLLILVLNLGLLAQASDLGCLWIDHCCCSDELQDDCRASAAPSPDDSTALAVVLDALVPWALLPAPPPAAKQLLRPSRLLPQTREPLVFQPCGLRAPPSTHLVA